MKILFYNHTGEVSGAERVLMMILAGLDRSRFSALLLCPTKGRLTAMATGAHIEVVAVDALAARFTLRPDRLLKYLVSFVRIIRAARSAVVRQTPDMVHANSIRAGLVMSAATVGLGVPVVWHVHDLLPRHLLSTAIRLFALLSRRNLIIAVSHAVASQFRGRLLRWFPSRVPVTTIHNAVDQERFQPNPECGRETRSGLGIAVDQLLIGTVGQLTPRKGQLELIEAFSKVAREIPTAVLMIVGEPIFNRDEEYAAALRLAARASGLPDRIRFLGSRDDVPGLMRAFDLLIVNSRAEPFGLTVTEAMASETTVLATAVDGIPEIVRHRESGWLVNAGDPSSLCEGMLTLLRNPDLRRQLGRQGRQEALNRFSRQKLLSEIQSFYRRLPAGGRMPHHLGAKSFKTELTAD